MAKNDRRLLAIWLPYLSTERIAHPRRGDLPLVTVATQNNARTIMAVDPAAAAQGLTPGLKLPDARALVPGIVAMPADPAADAACLSRLAAWCLRYSPSTTPDGPPGQSGQGGGLWIDISGAAHLLGGEARLAADVINRLAALGFAARVAIADTPGAAWALARFASAGPDDIRIASPGRTQAALDPLPPAALRLSPAAVETLERLGLRRIADLHDAPRTGLAARFGDEVTRRLDQALGRAFEPISPQAPPARWRAQLAFAEPLFAPEDVARVAHHLLTALSSQLAAAELGARTLDLRYYRADGTLASASIGTSRPTRDPAALARLFAEQFDTIDPGFGIEAATLDAPCVEPLLPAQPGLSLTSPGRIEAALAAGAELPDLAPLIDRLINRLGDDAVLRLETRERHIPEEAVRFCSLSAAKTRTVARPLTPTLLSPRDAAARPLRLLRRPEAIDVTAPVPDDPPLQFRWRHLVHRVTGAEGPERLSPEWWRYWDRKARAPSRETRDYYRVEDVSGRRYWLYRDGTWRPNISPRWYLHGFFG
jgi:protein ImuB